MSEYTGPEMAGWLNPVSSIPRRLDGKLAVVTGADFGAGRATATELARHGATVIMACHDEGKAKKAKDEVLAMYGYDNPESTRIDVVNEKVSAVLKPIKEDQLRPEQIDLSSFASVRSFASRFAKEGLHVDYLVNNAAVISQFYEQSPDGHEFQFAVNYLGPVLLTELLLPSLRKPQQARIVNVTSMLHFTGDLYKPSLHLVGSDYGPWVAYSQSKLALTMYTTTLSQRLVDSNVIVATVCPGYTKPERIDTEQGNWKDRFIDFFMQTQVPTDWQAAQTIVHALLRRNLSPGGYYDGYARDFPDRIAMSKSECSWLWTQTKGMLKLNEQIAEAALS